MYYTSIEHDMTFEGQNPTEPRQKIFLFFLLAH